MAVTRVNGVACLIVAGVALMVRSATAAPAAGPAESPFRKQALEESARPIRPGVPGERPFWNVAARRFIYAPAFDFEEVEGAAVYRFTLKAAGKTLTFQAERPWAPLSPVWRDVPVAIVSLTVEGLDTDGKVVGRAGTRKFYRAAVYAGPYRKPKRPYREAARLAMRWLYRQKHVQAWKTTGKPDHGYALYCYPSKIVGAVIRGMTLYAKLAPEHKADALAIANKAVDYLIAKAQPADGALPFFPPTYEGTAHTAGKFRGQIMTSYPAALADAYLTLYDETKDGRLLAQARGIAETYRKTQLPSGTWYLKAWAKSGKPVAKNLLIPVGVVRLMERLQKDYGAAGYDACIEKAWQWILDNTLKDYYWEGQFEDVPLKGKYRNLTRGYPAAIAKHILDRHPDDARWVAEAEDCIRFCEDQFVVWEKPGSILRRRGGWFLPCALEQYHYYEAIDSSVCSMINAYGRAYQVTGKTIYRAKAEDLANTLTAAQDPRTGVIPTVLKGGRGGKGLWLNCLVNDAHTLLRFDEVLRGTPGRKP